MLSKFVTVVAALIGGAIGSFVFNALPSGADVEDTTYTAVTPCAVFDSRGSKGASGASLGPFNGDKVNDVFTGANAKTFQVTGTFPASQGGGNTDCGIPANAVAVHINIVAVNPLTVGNVVVAAAGGAPPSGGIVNYQVLAPSLNNSNAFNVPLSATGAIDVYANCGNNCISPTVDVRGVVIGYYTNSLEQRVAELEALLAGVTRDSSGPNGTDRLLLTGMNLQIVDGSGNTNCSTPAIFGIYPPVGSGEQCNGVGNLIIGYNTSDGFDVKIGSHNLVVGDDSSYTSYSGTVLGEGNAVVAPGASVLGGTSNTAQGEGSAVLGGTSNRGMGDNSTVAGGTRNDAIGLSSSATGGLRNSASGDLSSVTGGSDNVASGNHSSVNGGELNQATGDYSSVTGGNTNLASNNHASVTGGLSNVASGTNSTVSGGHEGDATGNLDWVAGALFQDN